MNMLEAKIQIFDWRELAELARNHSSYYRDLYAGLGRIEKLSDLPVVDQAKFWDANDYRDNHVFTAKRTDGIVFKSGGTTGNPKFSVYSKNEWQAFCSFFGAGMNQAGLEASDRIANLFYVGELYASFIFIMKCIESAPESALQFPISGSTAPESVLRTVAEFDINVLAGLPTTIMNIAELYALNPSSYPGIRVEKIFYGGESMYEDQRHRLQSIFPGVKIHSIGYASVDAGLIGYADQTCHMDEHRVFGSASILEIVDEDTLEPIEEPGKAGKILLTNLIRSYMPIIRYPVGDRAIWVEPVSESNKDRKYLILGRSEEAARVGPVSVYYEDMRAFLNSLELDFQISAFQLLISHYELKDLLTLRIACGQKPAGDKELNKLISKKFGAEREMFAQAIEANKIHPLALEWIDGSELEINSRTGKLRRVIDRRQGQ